MDRKDTSLHDNVSVFSDNKNFTRQMRDGFNRRTAEMCVQLAIKTITVIDRLMDQREIKYKKCCAAFYFSAPRHIYSLSIISRLRLGYKYG